MNGVIKPITNENLNENVNLYISVFNEEPWQDSWKFEDAKQRWIDFLDTPRFIGFSYYYINQEIVGLVAGHCEQWSDGMHFHLREMCVSNHLQGKDIGTKLMLHLENYLNKFNVTIIYLLTLNAGSAESFYKKNGYDISNDMVLMTKSMK